MVKTTIKKSTNDAKPGPAKKVFDEASIKATAFKRGVSDLEKSWNNIKGKDTSQMTQASKKTCSATLEKIKEEIAKLQEALTCPDPLLDTEDDDEAYVFPWTGKKCLKMTGFKPDAIPSLMDLYTMFTGTHDIGVKNARTFGDSNETYIIIEFSSKEDAEAAKKIRDPWCMVRTPGSITGFVAKFSDA